MSDWSLGGPSVACDFKDALKGLALGDSRYSVNDTGSNCSEEKPCAACAQVVALHAEIQRLRQHLENAIMLRVPGHSGVTVERLVGGGSGNWGIRHRRPHNHITHTCETLEEAMRMAARGY